MQLPVSGDLQCLAVQLCAQDTGKLAAHSGVEEAGSLTDGHEIGPDRWSLLGVYEYVCLRRLCAGPSPDSSGGPKKLSCTMA